MVAHLAVGEVQRKCGFEIHRIISDVGPGSMSALCGYEKIQWRCSERRLEWLCLQEEKTQQQKKPSLATAEFAHTINEVVVEPFKMTYIPNPSRDGLPAKEESLALG